MFLYRIDISFFKQKEQKMKEKIIIKYYNSAFGELILGSFQNKLCLCDWCYRKMRAAIDKRIQTNLNAEYEEGETETISETILQLEKYSKGKLTSFNIPLLLVGTDFQKTVWHALLEIPYGKTDNYLGLSQKLNNTKAIRAVAAANGANAISIIVPCHRIIGKNGDLVGYAGGLPAKKKLLALENPLRKSQLELF